MAYTLNPAMPKVRQQVADLVRRGWSTRQVARHLGYSQGAVVSWVKKTKVIGYHPVPTRSSRPKHHPSELSENLTHQIVAKRFELRRSSEVIHKALDFLRRAKIESLFEFKCIQSDHGSEFSQHFTDGIKISHRHSRIRKPNDNAHLERFNRTIQEECLDWLPKDVQIINSELPGYLRYCNEKRHHFVLKLKTPMQIIKEVNTRY